MSDWILPLPEDVLLGRGMMGDGCIDLRALRRASEDAGYRGDIEVEIFNAELWAGEPAAALDQVIDRYRRFVLEQPDDPGP